MSVHIGMLPQSLPEGIKPCQYILRCNLLPEPTVFIKTKRNNGFGMPTLSLRVVGGIRPTQACWYCTRWTANANSHGSCKSSTTYQGKPWGWVSEIQSALAKQRLACSRLKGVLCRRLKGVLCSRLKGVLCHRTSPEREWLRNGNRKTTCDSSRSPGTQYTVVKAIAHPHSQCCRAAAWAAVAKEDNLYWGGSTVVGISQPRAGAAHRARLQDAEIRQFGRAASSQRCDDWRLKGQT